MTAAKPDTAKPPTPCPYCYATVTADLMQQHTKWHAANDLHAATCQKAAQRTPVHLTALACSCGLD